MASKGVDRKRKREAHVVSKKAQEEDKNIVSEESDSGNEGAGAGAAAAASDDEEDDEVEQPAPKKIKTAAGDAKAVVEPKNRLDKPADKKYINKQRVLTFGSRGIITRYRHLLTDLRCLMPHSKKEVKMDRKDQLFVINEMCEMKSCNNCVFFEVRKRTDLFMWVAKTPHGPSIKFHVQNVHTMDELKLTGNALKGSRPFLSFDAAFDSEPHLRLMKELFTQVYGTPNRHPKSKPFHDHVLSFHLLDGRIWFRNYQIIDEEKDKKTFDTRLVEIGPRFVLNPIRIFAGSFCGITLWENPTWRSPNQVRLDMKNEAAGRYENRKGGEAARVERKKTHVMPVDELENVFR